MLYEVITFLVLISPSRISPILCLTKGWRTSITGMLFPSRASAQSAKLSRSARRMHGACAVSPAWRRIARCCAVIARHLTDEHRYSPRMTHKAFRITSYNVCYTKLLRSWCSRHIHRFDRLVSVRKTPHVTACGEDCLACWIGGRLDSGLQGLCLYYERWCG